MSSSTLSHLSYPNLSEPAFSVFMPHYLPLLWLNSFEMDLSISPLSRINLVSVCYLAWHHGQITVNGVTRFAVKWSVNWLSCQHNIYSVICHTILFFYYCCIFPIYWDFDFVCQLSNATTGHLYLHKMLPLEAQQIAVLDTSVMYGFNSNTVLRSSSGWSSKKKTAENIYMLWIFRAWFPLFFFCWKNH